MDYNQEMAALDTGARVLAAGSNAIAAHEQSKRDVGNFASQFDRDADENWFYTRRRWRDGAILSAPTRVSGSDVGRWTEAFALARKRMTWGLFGLCALMLIVLIGGLAAFAREPGSLTTAKAYTIVGVAIGTFFIGLAIMIRQMNRRWNAPAAACIDRLGKLLPPRG